MESDESKQDLSELHADALTADLIDAGLLLRYAREPARLSEAERAEVETYLARSPAHRDELRLLVRSAEARGAGPHERGSEETTAGSASAASISSHPRWQRRAAIGFALAASLVLALVYALPDASSPESDPQVAHEAPLREVSPSSDTPQLPRPTLGGEQPRERDPVEIAQETPGQPPPALREIDPAPTRDVAETGMPTPIDPEHDAREEDPEPPVVVLALNIAGPVDYTAPTEATYLERLGVLRNESAELPSLQALVPEHVAYTVAASPTLYWYLSDGVDRPVELIVADQVSIDPALELVLEPPLRAGIHRISLAEHGLELEPGLEYRWFVSLSTEHLTRGAIQRVSPQAGLEARLAAADPGRRGQIYAAAGLWYDALGFLSEGIERNPEDARVRALRAELLEQAGLDRGAAYDRAAAEESARE